MEQVITPELCTEKHRHIEETLNVHTAHIDGLIKSDAANTTNIKLLMKAVWGLFGTVLVSLFGFLIWYIQGLT